MTCVINAGDLEPDDLEWIFDNMDVLIKRDISLIMPDKTSGFSLKDYIYAAYVGIPGGQGLLAIGGSPANAFDELQGVCYGICPKFRIEDSDANIVEVPTGMYLEHYRLRRGPVAASVRRAIIEGTEVVME